ncbi:MAG: holo-ACP synthase [Treponema sp.]|nr:holo-ACP synthase [Treponema sp.]
MIVGIGIDAVEVTRLEKWAADQKILERFFDPREIAVLRERGRGMVRSLAARFAAKEAFGKALGTGLGGLALKDIMVANRANERPVLALQGSALLAMQARGAAAAHVSLTHEGNMAIAMVVLEA